MRGQGCFAPRRALDVQLASAEREVALRKTRGELREAGYPAEIQRRKDGEKVSFALRIRHLATHEEAHMLADQLAGKHGVRTQR